MYIKRNGKYFEECINGYNLGTKENATECIDFNDAEAFIKYDMGLRLSQVSLEDENGSYRNFNGIWYNTETHFICDHCNEITFIKNANYINSINGKEEICYHCYDIMDLDDFEDITLDEYNKQ